MSQKKSEPKNMTFYAAFLSYNNSTSRVMSGILCRISPKKIYKDSYKSNLVFACAETWIDFLVYYIYYYIYLGQALSSGV